MNSQENTNREQMNIVIVGHVDHGKSTVVGRLLADTGSLPQGKLEHIQENCRKNAKPFEYAFLIDALKDEQSQGITIDAARVFFNTQRRSYIIIDAPGHIEFLKNMITGASRAEAALLVIDASEGVQENTRRHGFMLSLLGIKKVTVLVNKMDLVGYRRDVFDDIVETYSTFLSRFSVTPGSFIPISGMAGDNIAQPSPNMPWYEDSTVLQALDLFAKEPPPWEKPFRMPIQDVYKFTNLGDNRRIVAGTIDSGTICVGDEIVFYPSGKKSRVKTIEAFNSPPQESACAGEAVGFTLTEQIYIRRGEIACRAGDDKPCVTTRLKGGIFWLGKSPLVRDKEYIIKIGTVKMPMRLEEIQGVMDASNLQTIKKDMIERNDVAECLFVLKKAVAFDQVDQIAATSRFVIVDDYEIAGGGIILGSLEDNQSWVRSKIYRREEKWEKSDIPREERTDKYRQRPMLILITGKRDAGKKPLAKKLEQHLFGDGHIVYFMGISNVLYGVDADIKGVANHREEHLRRLAEVANIMIDAGIILIVTATELGEGDLDLINTIVNPGDVKVVWIGDEVTTDIPYDIHISVIESFDAALDTLYKYADAKCREYNEPLNKRVQVLGEQLPSLN